LAGLKNGQLLEAADAASFDVLITADQQQILGFIQGADREIAGDGWKPFQKIFEGFTALQVLK
jgi:hypothetical protein